MTWGPMGRGGECPSCKMLKAENKRLREQLAACAAGAWRTDVENAPKDGSYILGSFKNNYPSETEPLLLPCDWAEEVSLWDTPEGMYAHEEMLAFAVPNPPQVTT